MDTRIASLGDAPAMSRVLREIIEHTGRERPNDEAFVTRQYVANPASIRCTVAIDDEGNVIGFQSLVRAEADNRYDVPEGWGIIGTHISSRAHRQGVGSALFRSSREAAEEAGLEKIDAYIGAHNLSGFAIMRRWASKPTVRQKALCKRSTRSASTTRFTPFPIDHPNEKPRPSRWPFPIRKAASAAFPRNYPRVGVRQFHSY